MSLFQNWSICDKLPLPIPAKEKKNANSTDIKAAKIMNVGAATDNVIVGESNKDNNGKNRALTVTPSFDGLFHCEIMEREKKMADFKDTKTAKSLSIGAAINNVVGSGSKKNRGLAIAPAFDGLFPFEMIVSD